MIFCKELNKEFTDKSAMFAELKANKDRLIGIKKATIRKSDPIKLKMRDSSIVKAANNSSLAIGDFVYPVINTTNYLDSHGDLHLPGMWDISVREQQGKIYYIINHKLKIGKIISYPNEVEMLLKTVNWTDLGATYPGQTQALIFKAKLTEKTNKDYLFAIQDSQPLQNSVRMQYVDMVLCIDDNSSEYAEEYAFFYQYLPMIANKEAAIQSGYFWAIRIAKISQEGSSVLKGSNDQTPNLYADPVDTSRKQADTNPVDTSLETQKTSKLNVSQLLTVF